MFHSYITILHIKRRTKFILIHPLLAIFIGFLVFFQMVIFFNGLFNSSNYLYLLPFVISLFVGGYVATGLSQTNKTIIGFSEGIIFIILISILILFNGLNNYNLIKIVEYFPFILISAGIGGYTAKKLREYVNKKQVQNSNL